MKYFSDLHMHSTGSDGQYSSSELVNIAKKNGLQAMAITDHDSISGLNEAQTQGEKLGIIVIPGIEMSAIEYPTFHILGYGFNTADPILNRVFNDLEAGRQERKRRIMAFLGEKGVVFPASEVDEMAGAGAVGRPHFARVMLKRGICQTWEEVFDTYLDTAEFHEKVDFEKPRICECIKWIKDAGGKVSLAHPYQIGISNEELDNLVCSLKTQGLDAIECYHSGHTSGMTATYLNLAKKYDLHVTGGSDFHGENIKPEIAMTRLELELDWLLNN